MISFSDYAPKTTIEQTFNLARHSNTLKELEQPNFSFKIINQRELENPLAPFKCNSLASLFNQVQNASGYIKKIDKQDLQMFISDAGPVSERVPLVKSIYYFNPKFSLEKVVASLQ